MKTDPLKLCTLLPVGLLMASCNLGMYVPAHQNVPLFQKKGEVQVLLNTTNLQAAMAVGRHIGLAVNAQVVIDEHKLLARPGRYSNQRRVELAVGYFTPQKTPRSPIFEVYAGGGMGRASQGKGDYDAPASTSAISSTGVYGGYSYYPLTTLAVQNWNLYVQPAIGIKRRRGSLSFSTKLNYTGYTNATIQPEPADLTRFLSYYNATGFDRLNHQSHTLFVEPAITAATGSPTVRVSLQLFGWFPIINQSGYDVIHADQTFVRLGLQLRLNQRSGS